MATVEPTSKKTKGKKRHSKPLDNMLFSRSLLERRIDVPITNVGRNIRSTFDQYIKMNFEGKCVVEGYIKPESTNVISYSAGKTYSDMVSFNVVFDCDVCNPVEGMNIQCKAMNITKAGIRAESNISPTPIVVFIARDHNFDNNYFNTVEEGDSIVIRVIGQRYELNDNYISIVAELVPPSRRY
jgi:DNA-directed RNA polymerase subunit E'/Rpb7